MAHKRKQIRDAIATTLTGLATTGANVTAGRARPLVGDQAPPALLIYTFPDTPAFDEGEGAEMGASPTPLRLLTVVVEGYYSKGDDDNLDQIAVEVEEAFFTDPTFGGLSVWAELGPQDVGRDEGGARLEGVIRMEFTIAYLAAEGAPQG